MLKCITWVVALMLSGAAMAQEGPRVLLLTKSSGFEHSVIKNDENGKNHVSTILKEMLEKDGGSLVTTKDARLINALTLERFDLVIFYTTGVLTTTGKDGNPPMSETGVAELTDWVQAGGGFIGFHCATDSFHGAEGTVSPFTTLIGGEFLTHGDQFTGTVKVVDPTHPAMVDTPSPWVIQDEYYIFKNLNKENIHVLAMLELGEERNNENNKRYNGLADYPIIWCSKEGDGRVLYNAQGHREDVWANPDFQDSVMAAIYWATGNGSTKAEPNYATLFPGDPDAKPKSDKPSKGKGSDKNKPNKSSKGKGSTKN